MPEGRSWLVQPVPFHPRAAAPELELLAYPTASQESVDAHEIPVSGGVLTGKDCCDHTDPSKDIAMGAEVDEALSPTASQKPADAQEMPLNSSTPEGVAWLDHAEPLKENVTVGEPSAVEAAYPTASQEVAEEHDTPVNSSAPKSPL
jgi:cytoskeletal protein RodZ